ncbi:MAG: ABC transporter substrate-binding protein [Armatimonadota bacterium]|nr:ABC transporter substrate-binding protein [Armatimonadota bacterium]
MGPKRYETSRNFHPGGLPMRGVRRKYVLLYLLFALLLAGAGPAVGQSPQFGGELRLARDADSATMDPIATTQNLDLWVFINIYDTLVRQGDDARSIVPGLAERWTVSPDGKVYTFYLRPNLKFSDGTPVRASDVVFAIERARTAKEAAWAWTLSSVAKVEAPTPATVRITLKQKWAPFLADIALFDTAVYPESYFKKVGAKGLAAKPLGSGPFYLAEWKRGDYILLKKNPHYWDAKNVRLDAVRFLVVPDDNTRILKLLSGEVDAIGFVPFSRINELKNHPDVTMILDPSTRTDYLMFNHKKKPFQDRRVRQAISYAIDRNEIVRSILFGHGEPASSFLPKGAVAWDPTLRPYPYDPGTALRLMKESSVPNGFATSLLISAGDVTWSQVATFIKEELKAIGITVNIQQIDPTQLIDTQSKGGYEMTLQYWTNDIIDPDELVSFAIDYTQGGNSFFTYYNNPQANRLAAQGRVESDPAKREQIYRQIQRLWYEDQHMLALYHSPFRNATRKWVHDFHQNPFGYWSLTRAWLSKR